MSIIDRIKEIAADISEGMLRYNSGSIESRVYILHQERKACKKRIERARKDGEIECLYVTDPEYKWLHAIYQSINKVWHAWYEAREHLSPVAPNSDYEAGYIAGMDDAYNIIRAEINEACQKYK